jgi:hypothetical protein
LASLYALIDGRSSQTIVKGRNMLRQLIDLSRATLENVDLNASISSPETMMAVARCPRLRELDLSHLNTTEDFNAIADQMSTTLTAASNGEQVLCLSSDSTGNCRNGGKTLSNLQRLYLAPATIGGESLHRLLSVSAVQYLRFSGYANIYTAAALTSVVWRASRHMPQKLSVQEMVVDELADFLPNGKAAFALAEFITALPCLARFSLLCYHPLLWSREIHVSHATDLQLVASQTFVAPRLKRIHTAFPSLPQLLSLVQHSLEV